MRNFNWALIRDPAGSANSNVLEYAAKGVYEPGRKKIRFLGGADPGWTQCLVYDEASNAWSTCPKPFNSVDSHVWDAEDIDPVTENVYTNNPRTNDYYEWNGSTWNSIRRDDQCGSASQPTPSLTWDSRRNGLIIFADSPTGVCLWDKASNTWRSLGNPRASGPYQHMARFHPASGLVWLVDGNGTSRHWKLGTDNSITALPAPPSGVTFGCCGANGRFISYDYRTQRFVHAHPYTNEFWDYDIVTDTWTRKGVRVPLNLGFDTSNVEGFATSISAYGGVILYVVARGTGYDPVAYLYKHD